MNRDVLIVVGSARENCVLEPLEMLFRSLSIGRG